MRQTVSETIFCNRSGWSRGRRNEIIQSFQTAKKGWIKCKTRELLPFVIQFGNCFQCKPTETEGSRFYCALVKQRKIAGIKWRWCLKEPRNSPVPLNNSVCTQTVQCQRSVCTTKRSLRSALYNASARSNLDKPDIASPCTTPKANTLPFYAFA